MERRSLIVYYRSDEHRWEHAYDVSFPPSEEGFPFYALTPTAAGYPIVYQYRDDSDEFPHGYLTVKLVDKNGNIIQDTGVQFPSGENLELTMGETRISLHFSEMHDNQITSHPDGSYFQAWTSEPTIHKFSAEGDSIQTIELENYPLQSVTGDAISSLIERYGGQFGDMESDLRDVIGEFFPAFSQMLVMKDHSIWLRKISPEVSGQNWYHLSPEGEPLGLLSLDEGASLRNALSGHVYVSGEAEDGSPVILKYRISTDQV